MADDHALRACEAAATTLKSIGFKLACTSRVSEACYYTMAGYHGAIRVAAHRYGRTEYKETMMPVVGKVTFGANHGAVPPQRVEQTVLLALGRYFYARMRYATSTKEDAVELPGDAHE